MENAPMKRAVATKYLVVAVLLLLAVLHVRYYTKVTPDMRILQTSITNDRMHDLLAEKYPIVIEESIADPKDLLRTTFRFQYVWSRHRNIVPADGTWNKCAARYTIVSIGRMAQDTHKEVDIRHPLMPYNIVRMKLQDHQAVILPPGYSYRIGGDAVEDPAKCTISEFAVYDVLHLVLRPFAALLLANKTPQNSGQYSRQHSGQHSRQHKATPQQQHVTGPPSNNILQ